MLYNICEYLQFDDEFKYTTTYRARFTVYKEGKVFVCQVRLLHQ